MTGKKDYRCPECGSRELVSDAYARWDFGSQTWELSSTYDPLICDECGEETTESDAEVTLGEDGCPVEDE